MGVPPVSGGTMIVLADGDTIVAADPDRDLVHVASVAMLAETATVELEPGDEPGRLAQDGAGLVHVALRGAAALISIDASDGSVVAREDTCANPRGVAYDAATDRVLVACAGGDVVFHTPAGPIEEQMTVASDLRDVWVDGDSIVVTRFRTADVITVANGGVTTTTVRPPASITDRVPGTAWRTLPTPDGGWLMIHQSASTIPIDLEPPSAYGGSCTGPVAAVVTKADGAGTMMGSSTFSAATLAIDVALSPDGTRIAMAIAGESDPESPTAGQLRSIAIYDASMLPMPDGECDSPADFPVPGQFTSIAFLDDERIVAQSREPASLVIAYPLSGTTEVITLAGDSRFDTGHDLFHQDAGLGLACASCHPEGGDDGRVWTFLPGPKSRRTQPLRVGLSGTEPFHWGGEMIDFVMLAEEVRMRRMGGAEQMPERLAALEDWVFDLKEFQPEHAADDVVAQGRDAFVDHGCATCHDDAALTTGRTATIGAETLQVPSLVGIALRPPYMHDGRVDDLKAAVLDMLALTSATTMTDDEMTAVVAYLESL
jgi:hypothetical protein